MKRVLNSIVPWFAVSVMLFTMPLTAQPSDEFTPRGAPEYIAVVGKDKISQEYARLLEMLPSYYPYIMGAPIPIGRPVKINLIETELLFRDAQSRNRALIDSIKNDRAFGWITMAVAARHYHKHALRYYFGYPRAKLEEIYNRDPARYDSTTGGKGVIAPMSAHNIAVELFVDQYPVDTARMRQALPDSVKSLVFHSEPEKLKNAWATFVSIKAADEFFVDAFFREKYNRPLPRDPGEIVDKKEYGITREDVALVGTWMGANVPESARVRMLLRWKLFSERAWAFSDNMHQELTVLKNLALKYEVAFPHARRNYVQQPGDAQSLDTAVARLAHTIFSVVQGRGEGLSDPKAFEGYLGSFTAAHQTPAMLRRLADLRKAIGVSLLDEELKAKWWLDPQAILGRVDTLAGQKKGETWSEQVEQLELFVRDYSYHQRFVEVTLRLADLRAGKGDTTNVMEAFRVLYNGLMLAPQRTEQERIVNRFVKLFEGQPRYARAEEACRRWLGSGKGAGKRGK